MSDLLNELARTNVFTLDDLAANRAGAMSPRQVRRFRRRGGAYLVFGLAALAVGAVAGIGSLLTIHDTTLIGRGPNPFTVHQMVSGWAVFSAVAGFGSLLVARSRARDARSRTALRREGTLKLVAQRAPATGAGGAGPTYLYVIGGASYRVSLDAWNAAIGDLRYSAYETRDGVLLSIEPVGVDAPPPQPPHASAPLDTASFAAQPPITGHTTKLSGGAHTPPQPFSAFAGLAVLAVKFSGSGTAGIRILSERGDELQFPLFVDLANTGGFFRGSWGIHVDAGNHLLEVDHEKALGLAPFHWTVEISQPGDEASVSLPARFEGKGKAVVGPFASGESVHLAARNRIARRGYVRFSVEVLDAEGRATAAITNAEPDYNRTVQMRGLTPGAHWLNIDSDGRWTITVSPA
jgi:hypothetical protein